MSPEWVIATIAGAGVVFQAGIAWAALGEIKRLARIADQNVAGISELRTITAQHEWRITSHDLRIHEHDKRLDSARDRQQAE